MALEFVSLGEPERRPRALWLAPLSVILGSLVTLLPIVATVPVLPPFGLMVLLGWRMVRGDSMRVWASVPLGLVDDLFSGQPLGSAMLLWTLCMIAIDVLDTRLVWRDFWQDWLIGAGALGFCLIGGRLVAMPIRAEVDLPLLLQIVASAALLPLVYRLCAWFDSDVKKN